jgi:G:T-mismatch repair DNA endonuclease (very short patch repair protein)/predicted RNA-binding Zn-ribbon protein involved in translation (DUF1610 family)
MEISKDIRNKIIDLYKLGKGSTTINIELNIPKKIILNVLHDEGIVRKKNRCKSINIHEINEYYIVHRNCPKCGKELITKSKSKGIACRNHFNKLKNGSICPECLKKSQMGVNNSYYGKKHSEDVKKKISENRKHKGTGKNNTMSKNKWRIKANKNLIKKWKSGEMEEVRLKLSNKLKETIRKGKIKSINFSKKEIEIKQILENYGLNVIHSYRVDTKICDLYIPSLNLIIEYFGDYWHCNPKKYNKSYFNKKKNLFAWQIWDYDKNKLELVRNHGYNLEVVWESELKHNHNLLQKIINNHVITTNSTP